MPRDHKLPYTRSRFLSVLFAVPATLAFASVLGVQSAVPEVRATPACGEGGTHTPSQTEGPYLKPTSPLRTSLLDPGMPGTRIVVEGSVLTIDCRPMPRAMVDFWQADNRGQYDNAGYRLRGHQFTDDTGHYRLNHRPRAVFRAHTAYPCEGAGAQPARPHDPALLPWGVRQPARLHFHPDLAMQIDNVKGSKLATFDFILDVRSSGS